MFALVGALDAYALYALAARPQAGLPGATAAAWIWVVGFLLLMLVPLWYPTGRLPSPRWRPVLWLTVLLTLVGMVANAVRPGPLKASQVPVIPNPIGIPSAAGLIAAVDVIAAVVGTGLFLAAVASALLRFRQARGVERQQLKWFAYASLGMVLSFALSGALTTLLTESNELLVDLIPSILELGWPVALGIAILRYRLYDHGWRRAGSGVKVHRIRLLGNATSRGNFLRSLDGGRAVCGNPAQPPQRVAHIPRGYDSASPGSSPSSPAGPWSRSRRM